MAKKPPNLNAWKAAAEDKAAQDGYADPAKMIAESELRMQAADWHMYPWKNGLWVNVHGSIYRGNGGNQRDEYFYYKQGPWLLLEEDELERATQWRGRAEHAEEELNEARETLSKMRELLGDEDD